MAATTFHSVISVLEGDRIPPLKSHGQALEQELCFPGVLSDNRDASANLLRHFYGSLMLLLQLLLLLLLLLLLSLLLSLSLLYTKIQY